MGKGDIRTRRGKIWRGTTGVTRPRKSKRAGLRPVVPVRKVKTLKDLPKAVAEPIVKKPIVEAVKSQVVETPAPVAEVTTPVIEKVQLIVENVVVETAPVTEAPVHTETKTVEAKEKVPAKKTRKPVAPKAPAVKKPAAKKTPAKKKDSV